jgi:hypothetical protein
MKDANHAGVAWGAQGDFLRAIFCARAEAGGAGFMILLRARGLRAMIILTIAREGGVDHADVVFDLGFRASVTTLMATLRFNLVQRMSLGPRDAVAGG